MLKLNYSNYLKDVKTNIHDEFITKLNKPNFDKPKENLSQRFLRLKKQNYLFRYIFWKITIKRILLAKENELIELIILIDERLNKLSVKHKNIIIKKIQNLFKYKDKYQNSVLTPFFTENFNFRTCFYCNKDFITNFNTDKEVSTFQLDHFYDKGTYPYLALSFYNLIPSCPTCNSSKVKGTYNTFTRDDRMKEFKNETCIAPNDKNFDFHQKVKFKLFLDDSCKNLHIKSKDDIDITLKENYSDMYDKYIEIFKLNERYKAHKDIVFEMIQKAELYPESRLKELENLTGIPFQQIKKDIFNLIDENEDLSKQPFSKLIVDMSKELGIL
ncbi:hypothetical protein [Aliarcobacter butzleri]|uniref:hypothetical protein n=1 Tax=Aliarcobacter butzleri TaxID=28197 RepID=UPI001EDAA82F|nr:hypothetical protein [Aliarcobacter butzleri]MCG3659467.1 hypothetical protein [Aliarcobacter butzleri]